MITPSVIKWHLSRHLYNYFGIARIFSVEIEAMCRWLGVETGQRWQEKERRKIMLQDKIRHDVQHSTIVHSNWQAHTHTHTGKSHDAVDQLFKRCPQSMSLPPPPSPTCVTWACRSQSEWPLITSHASPSSFLLLLPGCPHHSLMMRIDATADSLEISVYTTWQKACGYLPFPPIQFPQRMMLIQL